MAGIIIDFLLKNLNELIKYEVKLLSGVEDKVKLLVAQLEVMNSYLVDFRGRHKEQGIGNVLVNQLRAVAYEAEDVIDVYTCNIVHVHEDLFEKMKQKLFDPLYRHRVAKKIDKIRTRLQQIYINKENFNNPLPEGEVLPLIRPPIARSEDEVVGLHEEAETIILQLIQGEPELCIIPIDGMGGLGKTTQALRVYDNPRVVRHFNNCRAFVTVSQDYNERKMLKTIIKNTMKLTDQDMEDMDNEELRMKLRGHLLSQTYLIVLDDVWKKETWNNSLNGFFPSNFNGSRIIITTRDSEVSNCAKRNSEIQYLRLMDLEESWELLCRKVFPGGSRSCPSNLVTVGKEIVGKCKGLPLAIVVLAGVLGKRGKKHLLWPDVRNKVNLFQGEEAKVCMDILGWSYEDLPHRLRWCFLMFGAYPEDFEIPTRPLIQLWIAEGLVMQEDGEPLEVSAKEYLEELIDRNLIQATKFRFDGGVKACRIHDLLWELCIRKAKEEKFLETRFRIMTTTSTGTASANLSSSPTNSRRLAVHYRTLKYISSNPSTSYVRSFLSLSDLISEGNLLSNHWKSLYKGFPLLRVLDLWGLYVDTIPDELGKLIHLRYLRLRSLTATSLPSTISNLWNIRTIEVRAPWTSCQEIIIWKLPQLRHLYFKDQALLLPEPNGTSTDDDDSSSNLQTLSRICPDSCTVPILSKLRQLVKLGIYGDLKKHMDGRAFNTICVLDQLQTLKLERDRTFPGLTSLEFVEFPANITKITLSQTQLSTDPMHKLGLLRNLQVLKLTNDAYVGIVLNCSNNGGFPQLQVLKLINLRVKNWEISPESMASLHTVFISRCANLQGLPLDLQNKSTLRELELWWPNDSVLRDSRTVQDHIGSDLLKLTIKP